MYDKVHGRPNKGWYIYIGLDHNMKATEIKIFRLVEYWQKTFN